VRCFVAVDLPPDVKAAALELADALRRKARSVDARWCSPDQLHVTLAFLGEVPEQRVVDVRDALAGSVTRHPPLPLRASGLGVFPGRARPRVVWLGIADDTGALAGVARAVGETLEPLGFRPEARAFRAHVTLARLRSSHGTSALLRALDAADAADLGAWSVPDVVLYRSHLHPRGARYEAVARFALAGAPAP
jgi:2'-5' RNA ligase